MQTSAGGGGTSASSDKGHEGFISWAVLKNSGREIFHPAEEGIQNDVVNQAPRAAVIPEITVELLQGVINSKNDKEYDLEGLDACWLLIHEGSGGISTEFDIEFSGEALNFRYESNFDRIYIFNSSENQIIELNLVRENPITGSLFRM